MAQCSICLSQFKHPVSLPCGHIYCKACLSDYINSPNNRGQTSKCPDCRAPFNLMVPDRTLLPVQFHPFLVSPIRRVYIDNTNQGASEVRVKELEKRLATKTTMEAELMKRCEALAATVDAHRQGERDANDRIMEIEQELEEQDQDSKVKIAGLENKIRELTKDNNILQRQATNLKTQMTSLKTIQDRSEREKKELQRRFNAASHSSAFTRTNPLHADNIFEIDRPRNVLPSRQNLQLTTATETTQSWTPDFQNFPASSRTTKPLPKRHASLMANSSEEEAVDSLSYRGSKRGRPLDDSSSDDD